MLKQIRKRKKLSQNQLALKARVNIRTLQGYEQGNKDINCAKIATIIDLAVALECRVSDLLTDKVLKEKCEKITL